MWKTSDANTKRHLSTAKQNIRPAITYCSLCTPSPSSTMRIVDTVRHLSSAKRNIGPAFTYCRSMSTLSSGMMRIDDTKRHLSAAKRNIIPPITYRRPMTSIRPSMMRLAGKKHHLVAVRRNIRLTYSSLPLTFGEWMEGLQSSLHSPTPHFHCSLSLFTFFCYHPSPPVDHLYFPSSQFTSVDIYCCGLHYLCLS